MISDLLFYQLLLVGCLSLCLLLHVVWPYDRATPAPTSAQLPPPRRQRSKAPTPLAGLTRQPLCSAWAQTAEPQQPAPASPPPCLTCTRGRRRPVDTHQHCCPEDACAYYG